MLGIDRFYCALALTSAVAVGCGGGSNVGTGGTGGTGGQASSSSSSSSTSSTSSSSSSSGTGGAPACMGGPRTFAVKLLDFGEGNSGEWKKVGFNIDGLTSTGTSKDVCQPNAGGEASTAYPDGDKGIDNSFGKNLLPLIISLYPTWSSDINYSINHGDFTGLVKLDCVPDTGDAPQFVTKVFGGTPLGMMPMWDGMDKWPVGPELLSDPMDPQSSTIIFDKSSITGEMFDSGKGVTFILTVPVFTQTNKTSLKLTLHSAQMTMTLAADRKSATGMIGGVLNTEEFVAEVKKVGALLGLCGQGLFEGLLTQARQASDIMTDGTQDPAKTCDGISMGLGFEMSEAQIGEVGPPLEVGMACP